MSAPGTYRFLSAEWIVAVEEIRDEYADQTSVPDVTLRANVVVSEVPFGDGRILGHIDTTMGLSIAAGHLDEADFTAEVDYETAEALFVGQDAQAVMQAFFGGKIRLTGDASKLLSLPMPKPDDTSADAALAGEVAARVRSITTPL